MVRALLIKEPNAIYFIFLFKRYFKPQDILRNNFKTIITYAKNLYYSFISLFLRNNSSSTRSYN